MMKQNTKPKGKSGSSNQEWNSVTNPAVRELLDHLAEELAKEYIRLMKQAPDIEVNTSEEQTEEG